MTSRSKAHIERKLRRVHRLLDATRPGCAYWARLYDLEVSYERQHMLAVPVAYSRVAYLRELRKMRLMHARTAFNRAFYRAVRQTANRETLHS